MTDRSRRCKAGGFLGWPAGSGVGDDRRSGWVSALRAAGLELADDLDRQTADGIAEGEGVARDLLSVDDPPTALVCASDSLALGAVEAARSLGCPVAVTGFDDTPVAQAVGLTSVSQPLAQAAARCVDLLAGVLDGGPDDAPSQVLLHPRWCCAGPPDPTPTPPPPTIPTGKTK